jgi:hypothetical protein
MSVRQMRALAPVQHPPPTHEDFDVDPAPDERLRMVGLRRGRSVGSDDQYAPAELPDLLLDPVE